MKRNTLIATLGLAATMAATAVVPTVANASVQNNKNNARNLAIAGAAVAGYGLLTHNTGATVLGAVGALVGVSQEQRDQNVENSWHDRWNHDGNGYYGGGYQDNRDNGRDNRDYRDNGHDYQGDQGNYQGNHGDYRDNGGDHNHR